MLGNQRRGVALLDEALELARAAGDRHVEAQVLSVGVYGDREPSNEAVRTALAIFQELGDLRWTPVALNNLGNEDLVAGRPAAARANLEESVRQARLLGNESAMCFSGTTLVLACIEQGDFAAAADHLDDLARRTERLGFVGIVPYVLFDYALLASRTGRHELAATLHGAADAELVRAGEASFDLAETRLRDADHERLRAALGIDEFERLAARGRALGPQQALALTRSGK
jgi:hypothetical protein